MMTWLTIISDDPNPNPNSDPGNQIIYLFIFFATGSNIIPHTEE